MLIATDIFNSCFINGNASYVYMDVDKSKGHWKALFGSAFFRYIQFQAARLGTEYPQINNKIIVSQPRITNNWFDFLKIVYIIA